MQSRAVWAGAFVIGAAIAVACGGSTSIEGFDVAFKIEGNGSLADADGTFRCDGPKDCGTVHFDGALVVIEALPASGNVLESWNADDQMLDEARPTVTFEARPTLRTLTARFAAGTGGDTNATPIVCGAETCTGGSVCCVPRESSAADNKPPFCAPSFAACSTGVPATCLANKDCTTPDTVCCAIESDVGIKLRLACTDRKACRDVELLCGSCEAPFYTCNQINYTAKIGVCVDPAH